MSFAPFIALLSFAIAPGAPDAKSKAVCDVAAIHASFESLYTIKGKAASDRVAFHKKPSQSARDKVTLGIGDQVLVGGPKTDDFRCAAFGDDTGALVVGFLPVANLQKVFSDETELSQGFLEGSWASNAGTIAFAKRGDTVVKGTVTDPSGRELLESDARVEPAKMKLVDDEDDDTTCRITIERRGRYLFVADNSRCGGKARFFGILSKVKGSR